MTARRDNDSKPIVDYPSAENAAATKQQQSREIQHWKDRNAKAIEAFNKFVELQGIFSDRLRKF